MSTIPPINVELNMSLENLPLCIRKKYEWTLSQSSEKSNFRILMIRVILVDGRTCFLNFDRLIKDLNLSPLKITPLMMNKNILRTYFQGIWKLGLRVPFDIYNNIIFKISQTFFLQFQTLTVHPTPPVVGYYKIDGVSRNCKVKITEYETYALTKEILGEGARKFSLAVGISKFKPYAFTGIYVGIPGEDFKTHPDKNKPIYSQQMYDRELKIYSLLKNIPCIVQLVDKFFYAGKRGSKTALILEYCNKGNLYSLAQDKFSNLWNEHNLYSVAICCLEGLIALGEKGIIHSDIKPENILIYEVENSSLLKAKIADFDLSIFVDEETEDARGSFEYVPPNYLKAFEKLKALREIRKYFKSAAQNEISDLLKIEEEIKFYNKEAYSKKNDVWSFGIVLFFLCTRGYGLYNLGSLTIEESINYIHNFTQDDIEIRFPAHKTPPNSFNDLVKKMLTIDICNRPTAQECLVYLVKLEEEKIPFTFLPSYSL